MSEEVKTEEQKSAEQPVVKDPFSPESWVENNEEKKEEIKQEVKEEKKEPEKKEEEEILDPKEWVKREYGWESPEVGKKELEELRKFKAEAKPVEEIKFANDNSKSYYEALLAGEEDKIYDHLDRKRKLSSADKLEAAAAIKLNIKLKNEHYDDNDVLDVYNEQYSLPKKPVQLVDESDDEFKERVGEYDNEVARINRKIERDAKDAKLALAQMATTTQLVLPDISKKEATPAKQEPTQQELEEVKRFKEAFNSNAVEAVKAFTGFSTSVKDKDVDFAVNYGSSDEEKTLVSNQIAAFSEKGFDANVIFAERWLNEDKTINVTQLVKDLSAVNNLDKVVQKIAIESANKRMEEYVKSKKNINLNETKQEGTFTPNKDEKTEMQGVQEFFWNQPN